MSKRLKRIVEKATEYQLAERERELIVRYYSLHLLDDETARDAASIIKFAAAARNIASMWADLPEGVASIVPDDNQSPISRAARIMYFSAELLEDLELKAHWAREACIAYLQGGNFAAARTALALSRHSNPELQPGDVFIDAILTNDSNHSAEWKALPPALRFPWRCADNAAMALARRKIYRLCSSSPAEEYDKSVGYRITQLLPLVGSLSLIRLMNDLNLALPRWYRRALIRDRRMILLPSQEPALRRWLESDAQNGLLCIPTSSGKTFVAELVGILELEKSEYGVVIFVVPYQAIAYNVEKTLKERTRDSDIQVVGAYGYDPLDATSMAAAKVMLICTPERLNTLLLDENGILRRTKFIVFDEIHLISQSGGVARGAFYECLVSRVLLEQQQTGWPKRICGMSAVVENVSELADWLRVSAQHTVVGKWRPNPLIPAYWNRDDKLYVVTDPDNINEETLHVFEEYCQDMPEWPFADMNEHGLANAMKAPLGERIAWYADRWSRAVRGPALVFCSSRKQTRELATLAAGKRVETTLADEAEKLITSLKARYPYLSLLRYCLRRGVAYHNASLPAPVRRSLEDLFQKGQVPIVYATTTLAEGSDFPFRAVVIASPSHYDEEVAGQSAMSPLLIRNIAGRGGRTTGHLIGDVVQMYSPFRMQTGEGQGIKSHEVFLEHLLDPSKSIIGSALAAGSTHEKRTMAISHLFSAFDRVVKRWPNKDSAINAYRANLFAPELRNGVGSQLEERYESCMLSSDVFGEPLATTNSPLRLTRLGEVVVATTYEVRSAEVIWTTMTNLGWFKSLPDRTGIINACVQIGGAVPEVRELKLNIRRPLKPANLSIVVDSLLGGSSITDAYLTAEQSSSSQVRTKAAELIQGRAANDSTTHERIEAFIDDLKCKVIQELPILIKAMMMLLAYKLPRAELDTFEGLLEGIAKLRERID